MESVRLSTADGHELAADIAYASGDATGGVVVCHPHPQYGGDRFNPVVDALFGHLPTCGLTTLRFDFRAAFGEGVGERNDVVAALDELERRSIAPLAVVGYSFGAVVALNVLDERIAAIAAVAPPLSMMDVRTPAVPTLVIAPRHDQFTRIDDASATVAAWPGAEFRVVESSDHSLAGRTSHVAEQVGAWLAGVIGRSPK